MANHSVFHQFVGAIVVIIIHKAIVVRFCRSQTSIAYYRYRPALWNITLLLRECGMVPLTIGYAVVCVVKLLSTTILYIGRLDTLFLHDSVSELERFGFRLDNEPYIFRMDILQHEAHRHPVSWMA
jgi:hypothetical protein